jgi:siroheme synthase-like protein
MGFYPAFLNLTGKECLVVGGGRLALHKTQDLRSAGARVTVVAPRVLPGFSGLKEIRVIRRSFRPGDLSPAPWLVVAATDDEALHARIAALCRSRRVWVNVVDRPPLCDFIVPAVVRRGPVTFAVSTGGLSPAVAKFLGAELRARFGPEVGRVAAVLKGLRSELLRVPIRARRTLLTGLVTREWMDRFKTDGRQATASFRRVAQREMRRVRRNRAKN